MMESPQKYSTDQGNQQHTPPSTPDDCGIVHIDGYVKIFDPNTNEILVEARE